jgi:SsrA-binding protein
VSKTAKNKKSHALSVFAENKRVRFDYEILETLEAGLALKGFEVKAIIVGSHGIIRGEEVWLLNANIPPYQPANTPDDYDPKRTRKILLKKKEIKYLIDKNKTERLTIVPKRLYNKAGLVKLELALVRGKKKADKREAIKKRETKREIDKTLKQQRQ